MPGALALALALKNATTPGNAPMPGSSLDMNFAAGAYWPDSLANFLTTTRASTGYAATSSGLLVPFTANVPRITDLGLLVEQAATNSLLFSQDFSNAVWQTRLTNATLTAASQVAPDGTTTAGRLLETTANGSHETYRNVNTTISTVYTYSAFLKANGRQWVRINTTLSGVDKESWFDIINGVTGTVNAAHTVSIKSFTGGWYRLIVTFTATATEALNINTRISTADNSTASYVGVVTNGYDIWGAQIETSAFPASYIPTTTVAVTRAADAITRSRTNPTTFSRVFSATAAPGILGTNEFLWALSDGATNTIQVYRDGAGHIIAKAIAGGVTYANLDLGLVANNAAFKVGIRMTASAFSAVLNGGSVSTGSGTAPTGMVTEYIGSDRSGTNQWDSVRKRDTEFSTGFTDAQLQALTT